MAILLIAEGRSHEWVKGLLEVDPQLDIRVWPNVGNVSEINFACVWRYPHGELQKYPNLKGISSLGAGVDQLISDPQLPKNVPIARVVDKLLVRDMTQFIILAILNYTRQFDLYKSQQHNQVWHWHGFNSDKVIGIMGYGILGQDAAEKLHQLGYSVQVYSQSKKNVRHLKTFHGENELNGFLATTDILVNLLPLNEFTKNILNKKLFAQLPKDAYIINVARGGHLVDEDLIAALDQEHLSGALLDVFHQEPLTTSHPFWKHPKIILTPHIASVTNPKSVAEQLVLNFRNAISGKPMVNVIDIQKGY